MFKNGMALCGNFLDQCTMSFMEKKYKTSLWLVCASQDWYQKKTKNQTKNVVKFKNLIVVQCLTFVYSLYSVLYVLHDLA